MNYLKISIGIFVALAASRFVPHPPNFTSLIALSFYVPAFFGLMYLPAVIISFFLTDLYIGMHNLSIFTWGSVILIGFCSKYFLSSISTRVIGVLCGAMIFFMVTNLGVWLSGTYGYSLNGFLMCYLLAIPFFGYTLISTILFSFILEIINVILKKQKFII